jgi:hypothetical protein
MMINDNNDNINNDNSDNNNIHNDNNDDQQYFWISLVNKPQVMGVS